MTTNKKGPNTNDASSIQQLEKLVKQDAEKRVAAFTKELKLLQDKYAIDLLPQITLTGNLPPKYEIVIAARTNQ